MLEKETKLRITSDSTIELFNVPLYITGQVKFSLYKETLSISTYSENTKIKPWQMVLTLNNDHGYIKFESIRLVNSIKNVFKSNELNFLIMTEQVIAIKF